MGRKRKLPTRMIRISVPYHIILKEGARKRRMSLGDYVAWLTRRRKW